MKNKGKILVWIVATLLFQGLIYLYFNNILFAPTSSYELSASDTVTSGKAYYAKNRQFMAVVKTGSVELYSWDNKLIRNLDLGADKVTYFKWLTDRNLALIAVQKNEAGGSTVSLTRINPLTEGQEVSATINKLPVGSVIHDVAFSTATNAIYMQVLVAKNPDQYRVYRTDANHDLRRVYLEATKIGRIATLFDLDYLVYDNLVKDVVIARHTDGSWAIISPPVGKYRLIGAVGNDIYIARVNAEGLATSILKGGAKTRFTELKVLPAPIGIQELSAEEIANPPTN